MCVGQIKDEEGSYFLPEERSLINCQLLITKGHCPARCDRCNVLGEVPPFSMVCGKCWLLEMLIASNPSDFVQYFPQIDICFISRGISLAWLQCIYLKLTEMVLSEIKFPLWHSLLIPGGGNRMLRWKMFSQDAISLLPLLFQAPGFLKPPIRALEGPEAVERHRLPQLESWPATCYQWNSENFLKSLSLGFLTCKREDTFYWRRWVHLHWYQVHDKYMTRLT